MSTLLFTRDHGDPAGPVEGFYLHRRRDCVDMPVKVWFGAPLDEEGNERERSHRWQLALAGDVLEAEEWDRIWPRCAALPIDQAEYDYRIARINYARAADPDDPFGAVGGQVDFLTAPLPFGD